MNVCVCLFIGYQHNWKGHGHLGKKLDLYTPKSYYEEETHCDPITLADILAKAH